MGTWGSKTAKPSRVWGTAPGPQRYLPGCKCGNVYPAHPKAMVAFTLQDPQQAQSNEAGSSSEKVEGDYQEAQGWWNHFSARVSGTNDTKATPTLSVHRACHVLHSGAADLISKQHKSILLDLGRGYVPSMKMWRTWLIVEQRFLVWCHACSCAYSLQMSLRRTPAKISGSRPLWKRCGSKFGVAKNFQQGPQLQIQKSFQHFQLAHHTTI